MKCTGQFTRGCIVSRGLPKVSRDHDCESWARAPLPIHAQCRSAERPSANGDMSAIRRTLDTVQRKIYLKRWFAKVLKRKEDVDGRNKCGHDDNCERFANLPQRHAGVL